MTTRNGATLNGKNRPNEVHELRPSYDFREYSGRPRGVWSVETPKQTRRDGNEKISVISSLNHLPPLRKSSYRKNGALGGPRSGGFFQVFRYAIWMSEVQFLRQKVKSRVFFNPKPNFTLSHHSWGGYIIPWNYPPPSNSDHQDYYMFNRESL